MQLQELTEYLLTNESISGEQFEALMEGREIHEISQTSLFDGFEAQEETASEPDETEEV